jgi:hypothetical protein
MFATMILFMANSDQFSGSTTSSYSKPFYIVGSICAVVSISSHYIKYIVSSKIAINLSLIKYIVIPPLLRLA